MQIKLTCSLCGGEVVYEPGTAVEQDKAHARLHKEDCAYAKSEERLDYVASNGQPVQSEALS